MIMELNNMWICFVIVLSMVGKCLTGYCYEQYTCQKSCLTSEKTYSKCGLWNWAKCTKYRTKQYLCAGTCTRRVCCKGYGGDWCNKPICHGSLQCRNGGTCRAPDMCSCPPGFSSPMCSDINECDNNNGGCSHNCQNLFGSYMCTCNHGYMLDADRKSCVPEDINECDNNNGGCSHNCQNLFGSYMCTCNNGYILDADRKSCSAETKNSTDSTNITNIQHSSSTTVVVGMGVLSVIVLTAVLCVLVGIRIWPEYTYSLMNRARSKIESFSRSKIESLSRCTRRNKLLDDDEGTVYFAEDEKVEFPDYSNEKF